MSKQRNERMRPIELVVMSLILAVFTGLVVLMSSRDQRLALIFAGVTFVAAMMVISMLLLATKPRKPNDWNSKGDSNSGSAH